MPNEWFQNFFLKYPTWNHKLTITNAFFHWKRRLSYNLLPSQHSIANKVPYSADLLMGDVKEIQ